MARSAKAIRQRTNKRRAAQLEQAAATGFATADERAFLQQREAARRQSMAGKAKAQRRYLQVPPLEAEQAKALGARWDPDRRQWWIPGHMGAGPFARWHPAPSRIEAKRTRKLAKKRAAREQAATVTNQWRYGKLGAAGPVKRIDPKNY